MKEEKLGNLCTITSSKRIFANQYVNEGVPFYRSKEIIEKNDFKQPTEPLYIAENIYEQIEAKYGVPKEGDMLLTSVGTLGIPYIVKNERFYFKDGNLTWFKDFKDSLSSKYLYYCLTSTFGRQSLLNIAIGSSQPALTIEILKRYKINVPKRVVQDKIVEILSAYDELIMNNKQQIKILEQMAENLYKEWFVRFRFPGYETAEFVEGVPKGWKRCRLKEFINFNPNYKTEKKQYYTNIPMAALSTNGMYINEAEISLEEKSSGTHFRNGDVLFAKITPCLENGKTGLVTCLKDNEIGVGSTEFIVMQGAKVSSFFTYCIARNDLFRQLAINSMNGADGRQRADISFIQNIKWILPDDEILLKFEHITSAIIKQINILHKQNQNLIKQRDYLLPRLMSGKLQVK